jgi:DNA-binding response OmpR family regulator
MSLQAKDVLIIDDTAEIRFLSRKILENSGMKVSDADGVDAAFRLLESKIPHVILLDLQMPGKTGFDFLARKQASPELASVPVIIISSITDKESVYKAIGLGAADYVVKPFTTSSLVQKVRKALHVSEFKSYELSASDLADLKITVRAEVSNPEETGFSLGSPVRLGPGVSIEIKSEEVSHLGLDQCVLVVEDKSGVRGADNLYFSRVNVMGLAQPITRKIRKAKGAR